MATYLGTRKLKDGRTVHRAIVRRKGWPLRVFQADTKTATRPTDGSEPVKGCMELAAAASVPASPSSPSAPSPTTAASSITSHPTTSTPATSTTSPGATGSSSPRPHNPCDKARLLTARIARFLAAANRGGRPPPPKLGAGLGGACPRRSSSTGGR